MAGVATGLPVVPVPLVAKTGATFVEHGGHLWELVTWQPGKADYRDVPSRNRLRSAMQTLARFHALAAGIYRMQPQAPPALLDRQRQWIGLDPGQLDAMERALSQPLCNEIDALARPLLALAGEALRAPHLQVGLREERKLPLQPAIRDIHLDHVLFTGDEVTGLIDFGAMRIDTPLADVARLVGSLVGDDRDSRQFALQSYSELRPLSDVDRQCIDLLDGSGVVLSAFNWLTWLYLERRDMGEVAPIARRLHEILIRLGSWGCGTRICPG